VTVFFVEDEHAHQWLSRLREIGATDLLNEELGDGILSSHGEVRYKEPWGKNDQIHNIVDHDNRIFVVAVNFSFGRLRVVRVEEYDPDEPEFDLADRLLAESIEHWQSNLDLTKSGRVNDTKIGSKDCPLCKVYDTIDGEHGIGAQCLGCPIAEYTGQSVCGGTPYNEAWWAHFDAWYYNRNLDRVVYAFQQELTFLKHVRKSMNRKRTVS
jgi:hypothetical protein